MSQQNTCVVFIRYIVDDLEAIVKQNSAPQGARGAAFRLVRKRKANLSEKERNFQFSVCRATSHPPTPRAAPAPAALWRGTCSARPSSSSRGCASSPAAPLTARPGASTRCVRTCACTHTRPPPPPPPLALREVGALPRPLPYDTAAPSQAALRWAGRRGRAPRRGRRCTTPASEPEAPAACPARRPG